MRAIEAFVGRIGRDVVGFGVRGCGAGALGQAGDRAAATASVDAVAADRPRGRAIDRVDQRGVDQLEILDRAVQQDAAGELVEPARHAARAAIERRERVRR